jgi:glutathione synthase/RimK-type ligase-like ATP-grasp enzyme
MRAMRLALVTCRDLPSWEVDDRPLVAELTQRGATVVEPAWDDPSADWSSFAGCLIRTTWDYMERRDEYVSWAERVERSTPLFNSARVVRWNTHKSYLRELESLGVAIIPTLWLEPGEPVTIAARLAERGWGRGFLKPTIGATARETLRFEADADGLAAAQAHADRVLAREGLMLQPYLERVESDGEVSAIFLGGELSHGVRKVPVAGDFRVQDDFGARDFPYQFTGAERDTAAAAIAAAEQALALPAGGLLYARADFLRGATGDLLLTELELVEPSLFFRHSPTGPEKLADALLLRLA